MHSMDIQEPCSVSLVACAAHVSCRMMTCYLDAQVTMLTAVHERHILWHVHGRFDTGELNSRQIKSH